MRVEGFVAQPAKMWLKSVLIFEMLVMAIVKVQAELACGYRPPREDEVGRERLG